MPIPNRLPKIAEERGTSLEQLIPRLMAANNGSVFKVAIELGVYPNTIYNWLKQHAAAIPAKEGANARP